MIDNNKNTHQDGLELAGIYPPIPTPFDEQGNISPGALKHNLEYLSAFDLRGFVVLGSNGEYVMLSETEKLTLLELARKHIPAGKLLIAGTGCQSTAATLELTKKAANIGADAALIITPSYYRGLMTPAVLTRHFQVIADTSPIPLILYNMPACTGIDLDAETIATLAKHPNIIGLKDSSGNVIKMGALRELTGAGFQVLAGSGGFLLPALSVGAVGGVLALANIAPQQSLDIYRFFQEGKLQAAQELQVRMVPVNSAVTARWGVPALKAAMDYLGFQGGPVRPPLLPVSPGIRQQLHAILDKGELSKTGNNRQFL